MNFVTAKHMKTFSFPENRIFSGNDFTRTKHSLNYKNLGRGVTENVFMCLAVTKFILRKINFGVWFI